MEVSFQVVGPKGATSASFEALEVMIGKKRSQEIMLEATNEFVKKTMDMEGFCTLSIIGHFKKFEMSYIEAFSNMYEVYVDSSTIYLIGSETGRMNLVKLLDKKELIIANALQEISTLKKTILEKSEI